MATEHNSMTVRIEESRKKFEDVVFNAHFMSTIERTGLGGCLSFMPSPAKTLFQDEILRRDGDDYKMPEVSAMWFGWKKAMEYLGKTIGEG